MGGDAGDSRVFHEAEAACCPFVCSEDGFGGSCLFDVGAFMVFWEAVVDAVYASAVAADVGYEFFCPADSALLQDCSWLWVGLAS